MMETVLVPPREIVVRNSEPFVEANGRGCPSSLAPLEFHQSQIGIADPFVVPDMLKPDRFAPGDDLINSYRSKLARSLHGIVSISASDLVGAHPFQATPCQSHDSFREPLSIFRYSDCAASESPISFHQPRQISSPCSYPSSMRRSFETGKDVAGLTPLISYKLLSRLPHGYCGSVSKLGHENDVRPRSADGDNYFRSIRSISADSSKPLAATLQDKDAASSCLRRAFLHSLDDARKSTFLRAKASSQVKREMQTIKQKKLSRKFTDDNKIDRSVTHKKLNEVSAAKTSVRYQGLQTKEILEDISNIADVAITRISSRRGTRGVPSTAKATDNCPRTFMKEFHTKSAGRWNEEIQTLEQPKLIHSGSGKEQKHPGGNVVSFNEILEAEKRGMFSELPYNGFYDSNSLSQQRTKRHTRTLAADHDIRDCESRNDVHSVSPYLSEHWAGPGYTISPSPSCLPMPSFPFEKSKKPSNTAVECYNKLDHASNKLPSYKSVGQQSSNIIDTETATRDLRRILHLDFPSHLH